MPTKLLWFLIYFVSTEGFGFRDDLWGGLGTPGLGWYGVLQFVVALISLAALVPGLKYLYRNRHDETGVGAAVLAVGLLPFYLFVTSLVGSVRGLPFSLGDIVQVVIQLKFFFMIYLFAFLLSRPHGLEEALDVMAIYALVAAVAIIVIIMFGIGTAAVNVTTSTDVTRLFRVIFPGAFLVAMGWILFFCRYLTYGKAADLVASLVCLGADAVQLHRGTLAAIGVTAVVFAYTFVATPHVATGKRRWVIVAAFAALILGADYYGLFGSGLAMAYVLKSANEVLGMSSDFAHRLLLVYNNWDYVTSRTLGLGVGFHWEHVKDMVTYLMIGFVAGPTFDSTYANIIIVFGLPGLALFVWLYYRLGILSKSLRVSQDEPYMRMYGLFLMAFMVYSATIGLTGDVLLLSSASSTYVLVLVSAVRMQQLRADGSS